MNDEQQGQIEAFTRSQEAFDAALAQLPEEGPDWREDGDGWSVREILHPVSEDCNVYAFFIEQALTTPGCKVVSGKFPGNDAWGERPVGPALGLMRAHRLAGELVGSFPDRWNSAVKFHDGSGKERQGRNTVRTMLEMLTEHRQEHTETIRRIAAAHNGYF